MSDALQAFSPLFREWFEATLGEPTEAQRLAWPAIRAGRNALVVSPTGSGKTLAAFYACLDDLARRIETGEAPAGVHTLYVSPLKALNHDVQRNLRVPLAGIEDLARARGGRFPEVRVAVRTGDTSPRERAAMIRKPPHVLITTPESLYLLLLGKRSRETLRSVRYVVVDEVHALAGTKRGAHLAVSLERLAALADADPVRVGLSATVRPLDAVARFLAGADRPVDVLESRARKTPVLRVVSPVADFARLDEGGGGAGARASLAAAAGGTVWTALFPKLYAYVRAHASTLVFTNNRRLAERVAARLNTLHVDPDAPWEHQFGKPELDLARAPTLNPKKRRQFLDEFARAHHGSMSRESRLEMEALLKEGRLPALVATSSLELGIDVGHVDAVALLGSPKGVARGLQRVGRSGHRVGETPEGTFFPLFAEDLVECAVVARAMLEGDVEETRAPENCLDVLAQQIVGHVAAATATDETTDVDALFLLVTRAHPYRNLPRAAYDEVLAMLAGKYPEREFRNLAPRVSWDRARGTLVAMPGARMLALANPGTIPDRGYYGCYLASDGTTKLGDLDEEFVYETRLNDVFVLGSQTWRAVAIERDRVLVVPAPGEPPRVPFWRGEGQWRDLRLSRRVARFRRELGERLDDADAAEWLMREHKLDEAGAAALLRHVMEMREAVGVVPSDRVIVVERFRDELGDPRVVIHSPFGGRVNGSWALALGATLKERLGTDVQTLVNDDGILLRFPDAEAPSPEDLVRLLDPATVEDVVVREASVAPVFAARFRENAERAMLLPKAGFGKRTPLWLQRMRAMDLLEVVRKHPEFPVLLETYRDVLTDVLDVDGLKAVLADVAAGRVRVVHRETDVPSPFATGLLFQFVGEHLYDGDVARPEARATLLSLNRDLLAELLGRENVRDLLRPEAVHAVERELQHLDEDRRARSPEELLHLLTRLGGLDPEGLDARSRESGLAAPILASGRARLIRFPDGRERVVAEEDFDLHARAWAGDDRAAETLVRRGLAAHAPVPAATLAEDTGLDLAATTRALDKLQVEGVAVAGEFTPGGREREWADRENLARVHRRTLDVLRREIEPVPIDAYARFLLAWNGIDGTPAGGPAAARDALRRLEGLALPGEVWERDVLASRLRGYDPRWVGAVTETGEFAWAGAGERGRFRPVARGRAGLFVPRDAPPGEGEAARAVVAALKEMGASHLADLRAATGLASLDLVAVLTDLARAGHVTSDSFEAMRLILRDEEPDRRSTATFSTGRWSLVRNPLRMGPDLDPGEAARAVAEILLARYGVVAREIVEREAAMPWAHVARALKRMEMRGEARRGYFVAGLSGLQFARPEAVALLRAAREPARGPVVLVSALDPASPYGTGLSDAAREEVRFARTPSTHLALRAGRIVLVSEGYGERLTRAPDATDADVLDALRALRRLMDVPAALRPRRKLVVATLDGVPAAAPAARALLDEAGFESDGARMVYWPRV